VLSSILMDAGDPWVQWGRGIPDFSSGWRGKRKPHRLRMAGPHLCGQHDLSALHLRLERGGESVDMGRSDAEELRSALGKAPAARYIEEIKTPDGELAYDAIQRLRHVLLSDYVPLARTPA
jgi:hypothetical protein